MNTNPLVDTLQKQEEEFEKRPLAQLARFYLSERGSGHTYAAVKGVENVPNSFLLVVDEHQKQNTGLPKEKQIALNSKDMVIGGRRFAVVPDNYTIIEMARKEQDWFHTHNETLLRAVVELVENFEKLVCYEDRSTVPYYYVRADRLQQSLLEAFKREV